jgi:hypothetical protein
VNETVIGRHPEGVPALAKISMDGTDLLVSSNDEDVCVWDPADGTLVARSQEVFKGINGLAMCRREAAGQVVAVASEDTVNVVASVGCHERRVTRTAGRAARLRRGSPDRSGPPLPDHGRRRRHGAPPGRQDR